MTLGQACLLFGAIFGAAVIGLAWFVYAVEGVEDRKREARKDW